MASLNIPLIFLFALALSCFASAYAGNFKQDCNIFWGGDRARILENGQLLTLSLDNTSGSGFQSNDEYKFGRIDIKIKLVAGDSAGTVTTFYLSSKGTTWDEIDYEFLGNSSGDPYVVHTNVFSQGKGGREEQFYLWFDPTIKFHTYSVVWNPQLILFLVDGIPLREFKNLESAGIPFPNSQPMRVYSTLWNADSWATRGGLVKTNWTNAPFTASYRDFNAKACVWRDGTSSCSGAPAQSLVAAEGSNGWYSQELDVTSRRRMKWVRRRFMIYSYCRDKKRFPQGFPTECSL